MFSQRTFFALLATAAIVLSVAPSAHAQAVRTYVSGVGSDANPCSRIAPCRTFSEALLKTAAGGEINALDHGGFGALTITKAITIDVTGVTGGIQNSSINGVIVNAGPNDDVTLRGLDIHGGNDTIAPIPPCPYLGQSGVRVLRANSVRIEDTTIRHQQRGIEVAATAPVDVFVNRVDIGQSCQHGIVSVPAVGGSANLAIQDTTIAKANTALSIADNAKAWLTRTTIFANTLGLQALGNGEITDHGDNRLIANDADGAATTVLGPPLPAPGPTGPAGATGATGATGPQGPAGPQGEPAVKLLLAASQPKLAAAAGKRVAVSYAATAPGASTLTITRSGKKVATVRGRAKAGANVIRWNGKAGKKRAAKGRYKLTLSVVGADGQTASTNLTLRTR